MFEINARLEMLTRVRKNLVDTRGMQVTRHVPSTSMQQRPSRENITRDKSPHPPSCRSSRIASNVETGPSSSQPMSQTESSKMASLFLITVSFGNGAPSFTNI